MRENPGLAATVPVAPPLSRRGLRSLHPGKKPPGCKGQRRFAHALFVVAAGPCPLLCPVPYLLKQWDGLNVYCSNGWVEIDNNIAENALRGVAVGRKNWLFAGSDSGGEHAAVLYSLIGTCRLNNVEPEKWLRYVIEHIQDWPANRVRDLLPWKVDLTSQ